MERGGWWSVMVINLVRDGRRGQGGHRLNHSVVGGDLVTDVVSHFDHALEVGLLQAVDGGGDGGQVVRQGSSVRLHPLDLVQDGRRRRVVWVDPVGTAGPAPDGRGVLARLA